MMGVLGENGVDGWEVCLRWDWWVAELVRSNGLWLGYLL
jgi:hypothetical protein